MRTFPANRTLLVVAAALATAVAALAQGAGEPDPELRAQALATRRAERDAQRAERMPSRPVVLRDPVPLPVRQALPPGGEPAGRSCPGKDPCKIDFEVPAGRVLVVSALWSASAVRCDDTSLGASPSGGEAIAPWWHCEESLSLTGTEAGFAGYLFESPKRE